MISPFTLSALVEVVVEGTIGEAAVLLKRDRSSVLFVLFKFCSACVNSIVAGSRRVCGISEPASRFLFCEGGNSFASTNFLSGATCIVWLSSSGLAFLGFGLTFSRGPVVFTVAPWD